MDISASFSVENDPQFIDELKKCSETLIDKLKSNKFEEASGLIQSIAPSKNKQLYTSVGNLTRGLHDAIVNFNLDVDGGKNTGEQTASEISDTTDRLQYVISMTQEAADKTMDRVEIAAPIALELGNEASLLKAEWDKLKRRELSKEDFSELYDRMGVFFGQMVDGTEQLNKNLQAIILEQGYQDLTGQVLKKVIGLVTNVEVELVNLVRIASQIDDLTGDNDDIHARSDIGPGLSAGLTVEVGRVADLGPEGPQIHAESRDDVVNGQDEVDDLLSSLGF